MKLTDTECVDLNPRSEIIQAINSNDLSRCLHKTAEVHGHFCPGSALGVMASVYGLSRLGNGTALSDGMENLMAIVEINACFADGIQVVSGCTLGNNALVYRDLGRHAATFAIRGKEEGIRVKVRLDFRSTIDNLVPEFFPLVEKVIKKRQGTPEDEVAFKRLGFKAAFSVLKVPFEDILIYERVRPSLPAYAPITESVICPACEESIMASKTTGKGENSYCFMCGNNPYYQVDGQGITAIENKGKR